MSGVDVTVVAEFFSGVALLCFGYGYMYRRTKVDRFREDLFTIRDEVFDYMWKTGLPYSHPAYVETRAALNGAIRFSSFLNLPVSVAMFVYVTKNPPPNVIQEGIAKLGNADDREYFNGVWQRLTQRLMTFLLKEGVCGRIYDIVRWCASYFEHDHVSREMKSLLVPLTNELVVVGKSRSAVGRLLFQDDNRRVA